MATIKLKKTVPAPHPAAARPPVRGGGGVKPPRPTLAQAQAQREEREARYQEQRAPERPAAPARPRPESGRGPRQNAEPPRGARQNAEPARGPRQSAEPSRGPRPGAPNTAFGRPPQRHVPVAPPRPRPRHDDDDDDEPPAHEPGSMRLSKRMSELGIASRREADEWIAQGWVRVDDQVVKTLGARVVPGQQVTVDAKARFQQAQRVTVLINKPIGYVSGQAEDGYEPAYVLVTPEHHWRDDHSGTRFLREHLRNLAPAGRLDIDSVGLLVLTQDGRVAKQLIGEDSEIEKEYLVRVEKPIGGLPASELERLRHGLELDGEPLRPAQVEWLNDDQLRFVLKEGKKRQIRRMCETVGLKVVGLKRVRIGQVMLGDLPTGQWRYLRRDEAFS